MYLENIFEKNGWKLIKNEPTHIIYNKKEENWNIEINVEYSTIYVSIPLTKSVYQYETRFTDYFTACEWIEMHIEQINDKSSTSSNL